MSPIDRLVSRNQAFETLGVSSSPTRSEIRRAYRDLAFKKHPDQHPECAAEFSRITAAYRYICEHADELGLTNAPEPEEVSNDPVAPRRVSRPSIKPSQHEFDAATMSECEAYLDACHFDGAAHVAVAIYRMGRNLTYYVKTPVAKGSNAVVMPTGMLEDARKTVPRVVVFDHRELNGTLFDIPSEICAEHFPGARKIQIRFAQA